MADARKEALKDGLRQLNRLQLGRLLDHLEAGGPLLLDRDESGDANYSRVRDCYCPIAIAIGAPSLLTTVSVHDRDAKLRDFMQGGLGLRIANTRGVKGEFYTTHRRVDLTVAAAEVWDEKGYDRRPVALDGPVRR